MRESWGDRARAGTPWASGFLQRTGWFYLNSRHGKRQATLTPVISTESTSLEKEGSPRTAAFGLGSTVPEGTRRRVLELYLVNTITTKNHTCFLFDVDEQCKNQYTKKASGRV